MAVFCNLRMGGARIASLLFLGLTQVRCKLAEFVCMREHIPILLFKKRSKVLFCKSS